MKIIAYLRVSTEEQARDGVGLDAQLAKAESWRALNAPGAQLVVFRDAGISGMVEDRPGLAKAMAVLQKGDVLLVYSLSRLSRSTRHTLDLSIELERVGVDLVSVSERIDTTTAAGKMVFRMLAVLAEFERDVTAERTSAALATLRAQGKRYCRYPRVADATVAVVKELRAEGKSYRVIARELVARGIHPENGGTTWSAKVVRDAALREEAPL